MKTNMAATSYQPRTLSPKYGQMVNVKPQTANSGLSSAVGWPKFDLKVSFVYIENDVALPSPFAFIMVTTEIRFDLTAHEYTVLIRLIAAAFISVSNATFIRGRDLFRNHFF